MPNQSPLLENILKSLDDIQAQDISVIDVRDQTTITDQMIICTGRSSRHVKSIAKQVIEDLKSKGSKAYSNAGLNSGDWALIDFGDIIVHVMQSESRAFYNLEGLWQA
jgi:ribosome-associated protein